MRLTLAVLGLSAALAFSVLAPSAGAAYQPGPCEGPVDQECCSVYFESPPYFYQCVIYCEYWVGVGDEGVCLQQDPSPGLCHHTPELCTVQ